MRLSAPPPPKRPLPANSNTDAAKLIAPTLKTSIAGDDDNANSQRDIQFPAALLRILVEDEKMVTKQMALPKLPARITVFDIFQQVIHSFLTFSILTCYCYDLEMRLIRIKHLLRPPLKILLFCHHSFY